MLAGIVAFARTPLGRNVLAGMAVILLLLSIYGAGQHKGAEHVRKADAKALVKAKADVSAHEATAAGISSRASQNLATTRQANRVRTVTLIKRIPYALPVGSDCPLPRDAVSVWNAAAAGPDAGVSAAPGGPDKTASGIRLSDALNNAVENFEIAYDWRAEALTWRQWYADQSSAWPKK